MKFLTRRINEWLIVLLSFASIIVAFMLLKNTGVDPFIDKIIYIFNPRPNSVIMGLSAIEAIELFRGGDSFSYQFDWKTLSMLINVILYMMIAPYLLFKGYKNANESNEYSKPWYWYVGTLVCIGSIYITPLEITHIINFENNKEYSTASRDLDNLRTEIYDVGFAIAEYVILEDGISDDFTTAELGLKDLKFEYSIRNIESDTLITLFAKSKDNEKNTGTMDIRPYNENIIQNWN